MKARLGHPWVVLGLLALAQWGALLVFALVVRRNGWLFYQGGDETFVYTSAWALAGGHIPESEIGYAWSYLLAPLALVVGPNYLEALPFLVLLQVIVLLPLALCCVYALAARIGGRIIGYCAAAAWVAAPYAAIPLWDESYHVKYVESLLPQTFGLTGLADFPSMVCLLIAAVFCFRALDNEEPLEGALGGLATGFAIGIKPANVLFLAGPLLAFAAARRPRESVAFALALLPPLAALALWKYRGLGELPLFVDQRHTLASIAPAVTVPNDVELDWSRLGNNYLQLRDVFWGVPLLQCVPLLGFVLAFARSRPKALLLAGWLGAFILVKGSSTQANIEAGTLLRLLMPAFPPLLILAVLVLLLVPTLARNDRFDRARRPGTREIAAASAVGVLLPLLLFLALPPLRAHTAVKYFAENVFVPVDDAFSPSVRRAGARDVVVSWEEPASPGVRVFYRVFRSRPVVEAPDARLPEGRDGVRCLKPRLRGYAKAADCRLEMNVIGTTRASRFVDQPPRGPWIYRVGMAANWRDDPAEGDVLLLSTPVRTR